MTKKRKKVSVERTVLTHSILRNASWHMLELADKTEEGRFYTCMATLLFSAFCIEAYLNYLGKQKLDYWPTLKKKLSPIEKLEVLSSEIGYQIDFGRRPFQTFNEIFKVRNQLVHAETEYLSQEDEQILAPNESPQMPQAKWEAILGLESTKRIFEDTRAMIEVLHAKSGLEHDPFWTLGTTFWTAETVE